jgi:acetate kinase
MYVLVINAGSSSLKYQLLDTESGNYIGKGLCERIGIDGKIEHKQADGTKTVKVVDIPNHTVAMKYVVEALTDPVIGCIKSMDEIQAVGHRIVSGGPYFFESCLLTDEVLEKLKLCRDFAPLHTDAGLMGINGCLQVMKNVPQVLVFDTAFHQTMEPAEFLYAIPYEWYVKYDVRKYGFHGLSHKFITETMIEKLKNKKPNLIICHIGNGASISAVKEGHCIDTSMGMTPNAGLMMGTRSGDIDHTLIQYVKKKTGFSSEKINEILNKESGLEGIAGMSDLRDIDRAYEAKEDKVVLAIDMYTQRIANYVAEYYCKLDGKVDGIVFTAGGGENDPIIRRESIKKLHALGIKLDDEKNEETITRKGKEGLISSKDSKVPVYVFATDEELMIARDTYKLATEAE